MVVCLLLYLFGSACGSTGQTPSGFDLEEPSEPADKSWPCEPARPDLLRPDFGPADFHPRIEPGCAYDWAPDERPVWFHTIEESYRTKALWEDVETYGGLSFGGFSWQAYDDTNFTELERRVVRLPETEESRSLEALSPDRGLFWGFRGPFMDSTYTHVFECSAGYFERPDMPSDFWEIHDDNPKIGWRTRRAIWKCGFVAFESSENPYLRLHWIGTKHGGTTKPEAVEEWLEEALRKSKKKPLRESERPFDHYTTFERYYYLEQGNRYWETTRIMQYLPIGELGTTYKWDGPYEIVHWEFEK